MDALSAYLHTKASSLFQDIPRLTQSTADHRAQSLDSEGGQQSFNIPAHLPLNSSSYVRKSTGACEQPSSVLPEPSLTTQYLPTPSQTVTESHNAFGTYNLGTSTTRQHDNNYSTQLYNFPMKVSTPPQQQPLSQSIRHLTSSHQPQPSPSASTTQVSTPSDEYTTLLSDLTNVSLATKSSILIDDLPDNAMSRSVGDSRVRLKQSSHTHHSKSIESGTVTRSLGRSHAASSASTQVTTHQYQHPNAIHIVQRSPARNFIRTVPMMYNVPSQTNDVATEAERILGLMHTIKERLDTGVGPQETLEMHYNELRQMYLDLLEQTLPYIT